MQAPPQDRPTSPLARVGVGDPGEGLRCDVRGSSELDVVWPGLRTCRFRSEAQELPEGYLLNHLVCLHLGGDSEWESRFEGRDWKVHRRQHHSVGAIPAFLSYQARERTPTDYLVVEIAPDFVSKVLAETMPEARLQPIPNAQDPVVAHVMMALGEEARLGKGRGVLAAESLASALVARLASVETVTVSATTLPSAKLRNVLAYVAENLDASLTLEHLADIADMEYFRFVRAFKQATGSSPHKYVIHARIARAKELLRDRDLSITDVALRTGFATPSHFSVTFRRHTKLSPRSYRDQLK